MLPQGSAQLVANILRDGYSVSENFLPPTSIRALADIAQTRARDGRLKAARMGKTLMADDSVRGDSIEWIDEQSSQEPVLAWLDALEGLRQTLNEQLFLNLFDFETHFAIYPPAAVYKKHLDRFSSGDQRRTMSFVLYLNQQWAHDHGGELAPTGGRLVLFESARFWHEVRPATRERLSITGWFRTRS